MQIDEEAEDIVADLIFLGSKITADGDCSHEMKRHLLLARSCDQPRQHIKKQSMWTEKCSTFSEFSVRS